MVSGLFGIICAGGLYCPLNPTDPYERVTSILEQLQGSCVLTHKKTRHLFPTTNSIKQLIFLDEILSPLSDVEDMEELPDCKEHGDALIICTSGTTGRHKAVVHSFRSLSTSIRAFSQWDLHMYTSQDQVLQVAACSWILHISEIMLPLVVGGTLVLLRPNGHLDMDYFSQTLIQQQVTTITIGPGIVRALTSYLEKTQRLATLKFVHNVIIGGEAMKPQQLVRLVGVLQSFDVKVCTQYGMTECNGALGCRLLNFDDGFVPIGHPLPGYRCLLINKQGQIIHSTNRSSEIGQLHIGGSALFDRYFNDPERTDNMFVTIDNQIYMKTGDLARYNERGELVHSGRIDFQVKVHGQRVETTEIENTIITWSSDKISNCLVTKAPQNDDFLVAYVVSNDLQIDTEELRQHCRKYLRQYMVPSIFIILEKLPLNANGKIDPQMSSTLNVILTDNNLATSQHNFTYKTDETSSYQSCPTTEIQQAYLFGRRGYVELGKVSCYSYEEYDLPLHFNIERLEQAWNHLIHRHEALRTIFISDTEQQILRRTPYYTILIVDLSNTIFIEDELIKRRTQLSHQIRPANEWPLFNIQVTCFIQDSTRHLRIHIGFDLLIMDLWSANIIFSELNQLYHYPQVILPTIDYSFRDYILAQNQIKTTPVYQTDKKYWIDRLNSFPLGPSLPLRCLPTELKIQQFVRLKRTLDQSIWSQLKERINSAQLSPTGFLTSIYAIVLAKWNDNQHFSINLPIFNRLPIHPQVNQIVGDFTSVIPLEVNLQEKQTFRQFFHTIQKQLWNDLAHMSYDGISFIRDLMHINKTREIVLPIVFMCGLFHSNSKQNTNKLRDLFEKNSVYGISQTPQVYLDNQIFEEDGQLVIRWDHVENLFPMSMIDDMQSVFIDLIIRLATSSEMWQEFASVSLPVGQLQRRFNFIETQWKSGMNTQLLHTLVINQAQKTPNSWAIISSQKNLTYDQLMDRVYSLGYHLQQQHEINSNQFIAILMTKGWEQIVACLAILVSGGAYLPLDVDSPYDRLFSLIEETNVTILLTQSHCQHRFPHLTTIPVDTFTTDDNYPTPFPIKQQSSTDLAYIIYTSGSTGKPKGVMISHQAILNTILDMNSRLDISTNDRIFALSHLNFDLSVYDIFGILIVGGTIVISDHEDYKNPQHWYDMIIKHHVTIWNSVPMLMQMFVEHLKHTNSRNQLRHILLSGDWIPLSLPESIQIIFGKQVTITSLGGATEASIWSIAYTLPKEIPREWKSIPYGIPLRNQQYYVYDIHLDDCPEWVTGELYIGGEGLASGYWNDQEKTQSSFIIHPLTNERLYRTGDYGRFLPNGYIEFMGRKDFQVKVHGHRIELGEIEHQLEQHPDIQQAIVTMDDKSQHLIGYIMPEKHSIEMLIVDPSERINFKLARHSIRHQKKVEKSFALTKPKLTETLINTYYMRKSYRQFTNEIIEISTIEKLLKTCHNCNNNEKVFLSHLDFDILSQLLAVLTPISISDHPLPKYRYASIDDLYPVQVYVELPRSIDNISPGVYYHNPDDHTLELISSHINNKMTNIRLHLVGRSSSIAPLYGKRLGSQFCILETGYVMGLLEKEGSRLGLTFSKNTHNESIIRSILNIDENDTHCCFKISSFEQNMSSDVQNDNHPCIIYLKPVNSNKAQWSIYNKENDTVTPFDVETRTTHEEIPLFFNDDNGAKIIFHDCQCAIFFVGQSECTMNIGKMSCLLMDHCLEMNIGMCPVGTRTSFPKQINDVLDTILNREKLNESNILHTLLIGRISNRQKYERTISTVKSMPNWSETLRIYLRKNLPMYMVPSHFISVSSFPLSPNGKIDRKALPEISLSVLQQEDTYTTPNTELEKTIANIWQEILYRDRLIVQHDDPTKIVSGIDRQISFLISTTASFFSVGGNSLLLVKIYQRYQSKLNFEREALSIRSLFDYNTILEHAKLLEPIIIDGAQLKQWYTLHINEGIASYAQERIFLDEQLRFSHQIAIYNELMVLRVTKELLSVNRLLQALRYILRKHKILRTSLVFNAEDSILKQSITDKHLTFTLAAEQTFKSETELHNIISQINTNPNLFDLSSGRVFYCQILRQQMTSDENHDKEIITKFDVLVIGFHHVAIDQLTFSIFLNDLCNTYNSNIAWFDNDESLQYIDYSIHERLIDMTLSREFWRSQLNGFNHECRLSLPVDRHCLQSDQRSGYASIAHISFDNEVSMSFLDYASSHQVTPFQLGLATFYAFLFKLTYRQNDLCISCHNANRYRTELQNMIGMFVSTLPYRIQMDSDWSFDELVGHVREKCLSILEHSHYTLQHILRDFHFDQSTAPFLQTVFDFITESSVNDQLTFDDVSLQRISLKQISEVAKFDFTLKFIYNPISDDNMLSCRFICSRDLFEDTTLTKIIQRFQYLFEQLFSMDLNVNQIDLVVAPIAKLTLILPDEMNEMQHVAFYRQSNVTKEAPASFAQARIWLDERIRFDPEKPQVAIYDMPFVYRLQPDHTLSIKQLRHALHLAVNKHPSLHTSLHFDFQKNLLMQRIITHEDKKNNNLFSIIKTAYETDEQLNEILHDEKRNPQLFDLAQGLVFRCHIIYYKQISPNHLLSHKDLLIFNFHHVLFDFPSMDIFLHDLNQAYTTGQLLYDNNTTLRYLDYAVIEQQMSMTGANMFWLDALHDCKLDQSLSLPYDRYLLSNEHRTGRGTSISFDFGQDLSHDFLIYASSNSISLEQLALATYYVFLFKLTNGEKDLCIGINTDGRYRNELSSIIGMFVNAIPLRCQLDPQASFHKLTKHVRDIMINCIKYSYFPLQRILNQHPNISNPVFLDTSFEIISSMRRDEGNEIMIGDSQFSLLPYSIKISEDEIMSKFDFILSFQHDLNVNAFSCTINASLDLFNVETVCIIGQRLQTMLHRSSAWIIDNEINKPIYELSLILSNEQYLMQSLNNTKISFPSPPLTCIHHEFVHQVMKHPQKLAVELDEQSLTYCELLYYVQVLSLALLNEYHLFSGEVVCQCVERSLPMVIGMMAIEMAGGVYCPLSPRDPQHRLYALTQQTQSRFVLIHHLTKVKFDQDIVALDIDSILNRNDMDSDIDDDYLSNMILIGEDLAYIIFTSGSTGTPKAVQVRHKNFIDCINSLVYINSFTKDDTVVQMTRCSFDIHVQEILGETFAVPLIELVVKTGITNCIVWNLYGPAETTIISTFHRVDLIPNTRIVSIGTPLCNYRCMIMNEYSQQSVIDQEGELFIGGVGIFAGYLGRDDLTAKALLEIDGQLFYRAGDLVKMDSNGLLHYQGRKDHQIKLHGQRIELGEIERCLLNITSISACVVVKWKDDHLIAYVQTSNVDEVQLREHCQSYLPPHMIPSIFIILEKLPLNANGKIDRKRLPSPDFLSQVTDYGSNVPSTTLEQQLQKIFNQAFHIESPPMEVPFGQLGGTSLDAMRALTLIRQQVYTNIDIGLLFTNPSIRQLAIAIEPLLISNQSQKTVFTANQSHETHVRFSPSFVIESVGIIFLVCQWLCPIIIIHQWCPLLFPILPIYHLLFYVIWLNLLSPRDIKTDNLFSWSYYRWWFLDRIWNNNTFWLQHILGTPLYNYYLRLCGARISLNIHIYTTTIDAPWLLDIDDGSWIANETYLNCLYFNDDDTFKLSPIRIGSSCSIGARSILFDGVDMQNNIIVQPMSSVTGFVASETIIDGEEHKSRPSDISVVQSNRSYSIWHKIYQIIVIISIICIHCTLLIMVYKAYSVKQILLPISIAFCWTLWSVIGCFISLLLLKFIVGPCAAGEIYPIASWLYLQKIWLRQLIISSFHHAWLLPTGYEHLYPYVLRWLGAKVEENVILGKINTFLSCPTNLLKFEMGVTAFGGVLIVSTELTLSGNHRVDQIMLGSHTNLGNRCSILPGSCLASETMIGNLTRISRETKSEYGGVFMGVPARIMPFQMPCRPEIQDQIEIIPFWHTCLSHYVSKCLLLSIYSFGGLVGGSMIHTMLAGGLYRCRSYKKRHEIVQQIIARINQDHEQFICPFLGNTQWLIRLFRVGGAHIGKNSIVADISCLTDFHLITIGDDTRLNVRSQILCHSFEQRILKQSPVSIGNSCILMTSSIVMAGCKLTGNNRLYPGTLIMKNDQLSPNTHWKGIPAQSCTIKARLSRSTIAHNDPVIYQQGYETINKLFPWYERIAGIYMNINELQFMNCGYADMDEYIDDHTGYYSRKLYEQVFANVISTDKNILEINFGRGAGAAWCVHTHAPHSYIGIDPSQDVINLCQRLYSTTPRLSFVVGNPTKHLPFENESIDIILCIEAKHAFGEPISITQFANEVIRVLRPNGYLLWCDFCYMNGSGTSTYDLIANDELIIEEKINITRNVLHALDIQNKSRIDFIQRYIQPEEQEYFRLFAGLPGTQVYEDMSQGRSQYWRVVFRKKTTTNISIT
ncbi:unnamed protein product [Adineta steineri]|uniref:Carrier domain-containing protein n=1 Tax=Adineta steineri TaxID=433720 RepID=A0A815EN60_9BILA|nr:unnamed protein product [Adineta steineri]CAF1558689.1 unnamed protein product [Adineta steineri]